MSDLGKPKVVSSRITRTIHTKGVKEMKNTTSRLSVIDAKFCVGDVLVHPILSLKIEISDVMIQPGFPIYYTGYYLENNTLVGETVSGRKIFNESWLIRNGWTLEKEEEEK
ncbi:MAG: hypothetical protein WC998_00650 [Candidatus Paceibacterota bacterium]|jgi:hypothetical protein